MAERKSTNKWYPPDWKPSDGSLNAMQGKHHLGDRARKLDQGILIVRIDLPFDIWCASCNELLPHGRRYNAEKKQAGKYLSIPILSFRFKCNACANYIDIHTDPKNSDFIVASGGKRKVEESQDSPANEGLPSIKTNEEREALLDPFAALEHARDDKEAAEVKLPELQAIWAATERRQSDSVAKNRLLRSLARGERKQNEALAKESKERGLGISLLPSTIEDESEARTALAGSKYRHGTKLQTQAASSLKTTTSGSIFDGKSQKSASSAKKHALMAHMIQKKVDMSIFQPKKTR